MRLRKAYLKSVDDQQHRQRSSVIGLNGEQHDDVELFQQYGFSSVPMDETDEGAAESLLLDAHGVKVSIGTCDNRFRPRNNQQGDVLIYTKNQNQTILLTTQDDQPVTILTVGSSVVTIKVDGVTIDGKVTINGDFETTGSFKNNGVNVGSTHKHSGVQSGGGNTGNPN